MSEHEESPIKHVEGVGVISRTDEKHEKVAVIEGTVHSNVHQDSSPPLSLPHQNASPLGPNDATPTRDGPRGGGILGHQTGDNNEDLRTSDNTPTSSMNDWFNPGDVSDGSFPSTPSRDPKYAAKNAMSLPARTLGAEQQSAPQTADYQSRKRFRISTSPPRPTRAIAGPGPSGELNQALLRARRSRNESVPQLRPQAGALPEQILPAQCLALGTIRASE